MRDLVHVKDGNVEGVLQAVGLAERSQNAPSDAVVIVLQRAVDAAVLLAEINAAEVTQQAVHAADDLALQRCLHQLGGERIIYVTLLGVHGNALNVAAAPRAGIDRLLHRKLLSGKRIQII
jgi:hypothetical protein